MWQDNTIHGEIGQVQNTLVGIMYKEHKMVPTCKFVQPFGSYNSNGLGWVINYMSQLPDKLTN